ncbi:hypothetical protein ABZ883_14985 [Streptomyces sp. NPDC046977]|uniref:hypothetical protein n=1 Tax=Streptomyces sp. NPDC046977 TaxID=3154703 RepID=UPI0033F845C5
MRPRIESIAARLLAATGTEVERAEDADGVRLTVPVPADIDDTQRAFLLAALADADGYGHEQTADGTERAWALIARDLRLGGFDAAASVSVPVVKTLPGGEQEVVEARVVGPAELLPIPGRTAFPCTCPKCAENGVTS